ncbi:D-aspartate oxidase [Anthonomus grandis grandis]|uniref:D-aspartate oxidase n=1 Tax=Anthonomus grandis grandis TaxID=2921223 RepID=UPI002165BA3F|nr:D-aspartate oxidase [Anthonomus grandis grandis]
MTELKIAVVGAGVIGVTTACELQKRFRNANIKIVANEFFEGTTSYVAAGIFCPGTSFSGPTDEITEKWVKDSYYYWENVKDSNEAGTAGVIEISGYMFSSSIPDIVRNSFMEKVCPLYRAATREELKICPGNWKYGSYFTTLVTQSSLYIPWAFNKFKSNGGQIERRKVESLESLAKENDVVVNCTGLGAKFLCKDRKIVPIRGQVIKVRAPWLKNFFYGDYDTYIIPGVDSVTLGGCRQYQSWDLKVNKYDEMQIKEKCERMVPSLARAEVIGSKVGLRPHRETVRVEKEMKNFDGKRVKIVHNYGHGGYGVTTAPGTALHACDLVHELLAGNNKL